MRQAATFSMAVTALVVLASCKTPFGETTTTAELSSTSPLPEGQATELTEQCRNAPRLMQINSAEGAVIYRTVSANAYLLQPTFDVVGKALSGPGGWQLSAPFGANPDLPACLAGRNELSHEEFLGALGCTPFACEERAIGEVDFDEHASNLSRLNLSRSGDQPEQGFALLDGLQGYPFKVNDCEDPLRYWHAVKKDAQGQLKCKVDTLYSWGPMEKITYMKRQGFDRDFFEHHETSYKRGSVFFTTNPIGSFGYGRYQIRVKLKPNVKYKVILNDSGSPYSYCDDHMTANEVKDTIIVRYFDPILFRTSISGLDFIICGPGPIDSWSYGTQESLDEILLVDAEYWKFRRGSPAWYAGKDWYKYMEYYAKLKGVDIFDKNGNPDSRNFTYDWYKGNVSALQQLIRSGDGGVFANPDGSGSANHFNTQLPFYFNPN